MYSTLLFSSEKFVTLEVQISKYIVNVCIKVQHSLFNTSKDKTTGSNVDFRQVNCDFKTLHDYQLTNPTIEPLIHPPTNATTHGEVPFTKGTE